MTAPISYYNLNSEAFYERTIHADLSHAYERLQKWLTKPARILDAGSGSGRDTSFFIKQGFDVTAFDASTAMVELSTKFTGQETLQMMFQDMAFDKEFHAVWACASLLHVPYPEMRSVFEKIHRALLDGGMFYASFKYGNEARGDSERTFYDMDEMSVKPYLEQLFEVVEIWKTPDRTSTASPSPAKAWLNLLARKI